MIRVYVSMGGRGETRALIGGGGGGEVNILIFVFCQTSFGFDGWGFTWQLVKFTIN